MEYDSIYDEFANEYFDYNPAHAVWYLLVQIGIPESLLHPESFLAAAITLYNEKRGISARMLAELDAKGLIKQILEHVGGVLLWGTDGKFHLVLIRDDYVVEDLPVVNENIILDKPLFNRASWPDTYGEIQIQYNKRIYPPGGLRYYQEAIEVVRRGRPYVRLYEEVIEVVRRGRPFVRSYYEVIEAIHGNVQACLDDIAILWASSTTTTTVTGSTTTVTGGITTTSTTVTSTTVTSTTAPPEYFSMESEAHLILSDDSSIVF